MRPGRSQLTRLPLRDLDASLKTVIFNLPLLIGFFRSSDDNAPRWMPWDFMDDKSTLVQVMAWCHQPTSHYLSQCWPSSMSRYGVTRPQWVKKIMWMASIIFSCLCKYSEKSTATNIILQPYSHDTYKAISFSKTFQWYMMVISSPVFVSMNHLLRWLTQHISSVRMKYKPWLHPPPDKQEINSTGAFISEHAGIFCEIAFHIWGKSSGQWKCICNQK